jgi:hypothetical protein
VIDIEEEMIEVLKPHRMRQEELKLALGHLFHDDGFVFTKMRFSKYGYPMLENTIKRWMNSLLKFHTDIKKHMSPHGASSIRILLFQLKQEWICHVS